MEREVLNASMLYLGPKSLEGGVRRRPIVQKGKITKPYFPYARET